MDYKIQDSSLYYNPQYGREGDINRDYSIRLGIVRDGYLDIDKQHRYTVEVTSGNKQIPISCVQVVKFGGVHNFEEYTLRAWATKTQSSPTGPASNANFKYRSGDTVVVAYIAGSSKEGLILGGLKHPARDDELDPDTIQYKSVFNGLTVHIRDDGSYKVEFKGKAINTPALELPPTGVEMPKPEYNPLISGSFFGFDKDGSYLASDGKQYLKMLKSQSSPITVLSSGSARVELGGSIGSDKFAAKSTNAIVEAGKVNIKGSVEMNLSGLQTSIKAQRIAIGNDQVELFKSLFDILDALSKVFVITPVGNSTPIGQDPTWISIIEPLKLKIKAATGSLKDPEAFSETDVGDVKLESE